ncbi:hypothetical protein KAR91_40820 [Candidatus Pacearchaeota archaeon]|nr:hypothetical protein [Candidatus Pacearchaeota archaeon]
MGNNSLTTRSSGEIITSNFFNDFNTALGGDFVGRNSSGVPTSAQNLGTAAVPWGTARINSLILNGSTLDPSLVTVPSNRVVSGATSANSSLTNFLDPVGAAGGLSATILATTTNLVVDINGTEVTASSDIALSSLTAAPSSNNTCQVDDSTMTNDKFAGEERTTITIGTVGTEISSLVGQFAAFQTPTGEFLFAYIKSATELTSVYRGFYFDDSLAGVVRGNLSNTDVLTLMKIGWVFLTNDGTTADVSYTTPVWSDASPSAPSTGDYWYDLGNDVWKRYSGSAFEIISRTLIGQVVSDDTDCLAARSLDAYFSVSEFNNIELEIFSTEIIQAKNIGAQLNVYGNSINFGNSLPNWNITVDRESGVSESASTGYYFYVAEDGDKVISDERPHKRDDLGAYYHPYESWRCIGVAFNDSGSDLVCVSHVPYNSEIKEQIVYIKDVKADNVDGGTITAGSYTTRTLNTVEGETSIVSVDTNQVTVLPGKTIFEISAPALLCDAHKANLYSITDTAIEIIGTAEYADSNAGGHSQTSSKIFSQIQKFTPKIYDVRHRCDTTRATDGFGRGSNFGINEIYTLAKITRVK